MNIYHKYLYWMLTPFLFLYVVINGIVGLYFYAQPSHFYFRPWEYFEEVVYKFNGVSLKWNDSETSDQTRDYFFYYQDDRDTVVTVDKEGFRRSFQDAQNYPVLVSGRSMIFGSGLSDNETVPWLLSKKLNIPVFNGGRSSVFNVLKKKQLSNVQVIIQCNTERVIRKGLYKSDFANRNTEYVPLRNPMEKSLFNFFSNIPAERYLVTSLMRRTFQRLSHDLGMFLKNGSQEEYFFHRYKLTENDLIHAVHSIKRQSEEIESRGIRYIYMPIPSKQSLYSENVDAYTLHYLRELHHSLNEVGVENIPLYQQFNLNKDKKLFYSYDTHWNSTGSSLAATVIANYLEKKDISD